MQIFFDVDYTILASDHTLRRHTREVFGRLGDDGHGVHIWSGEGRRDEFVDTFGLRPLVSGVYAKPLSDFAAGLQRFGVDVVPDFVVDDYPQIVAFFGGYHITDFYSARTDDDEIATVYSVVTELVATGRSSHARWKPRHPDFESVMARAARDARPARPPASG